MFTFATFVTPIRYVRMNNSFIFFVQSAVIKLQDMTNVLLS